jgi:hypothetical protein
MSGGSPPGGSSGGAGGTSADTVSMNTSLVLSVDEPVAALRREREQHVVAARGVRERQEATDLGELLAVGAHEHAGLKERHGIASSEVRPSGFLFPWTRPAWQLCCSCAFAMFGRVPEFPRDPEPRGSLQRAAPTFRTTAGGPAISVSERFPGEPCALPDRPRLTAGC